MKEGSTFLTKSKVFPFTPAVFKFMQLLRFTHYHHPLISDILEATYEQVLLLQKLAALEMLKAFSQEFK